ncbi:MAG: SO_0444 family Cu/Zn efflux transporter [Phycisphaerae bacterium]|jgi:uncharacterized membrane protein YraQ (UPF0718 family)
MTAFLTTWLMQTWQMVMESAPWLLGGFLLAGLIYVFVPVDRVVHHLGKPGLRPVVKASLFGIPLPLCSCSVIPVATSIRKQGASRGAFVSFLISTPETGVDSISLSYALLGPLLAIVRPVAAFVTAVAAGILISRTGEEQRAATGRELAAGVSCGCSSEDSHTTTEREPAPAASCCSTTAPPAVEDSCCAASACGCEEPSTKPGAGKLATAIRYGLVDMMTDLSPYLLGGFVLAGLAAAALPEGFLEQHIGSGIVAMLLMLVVGLPLYVCATSSTPVAAALIARGLSPGAALVFLLVGPATNIATMLIVSRDLGKRGLAIYLSTIAVVAVLFGLLIDALIPSLPVSLADTPHCLGEHTHAAMIPFAILLTLLILNGLRRRRAAKSTPEASPD